MAISERLQILITADAKGAQREFQKFGRDAEKAIGQTENKMRALSGQLTSFGVGALAAGGVAAAGLYQAADAANDLAEAQNKANVILGQDGASALQDFANTAAETAGISQRAALEAGAGFGLFVEKAGLAGEEAGEVSAQLVQLAGDIASLNNIPVEEALTSISSALAGEAESIRRLGIDISDAALKQAILERTGEKVTGTLSQQAKTVEILNQLFEQGAVFQDDFINTSDSLSNRQKTLAADFENTKAAIGEALLPTFEALVGAVGGVIEGFNNLPKGTQQAIGTIGGVATAATIGAGGLALLAGGALRTVDTLRQVRDRVGNTAPWSRFNNAVQTSTGSLSAFQGVGRGLAVAGGIASVALLGDALYGLTQDAEQAKAALEEFKALDLDEASFEQAFAVINRVAEEQLSLIDRLRQPVGGQDDILGISGDVLSNLTRVETVLENLFKSSDTQGLEDTIRLLRDVAELDVNEGIAPELLALADKYERALNNTREARKRDEAAARSGADATREGGEATDDAASAADGLADTLKELAGSQKLANVNFLAGKAAADAFAESIEASTSANNRLAAGLSAGQALASLREGITGQERFAEAAADAAESQADLNEETDGTADAVDRLAEVVRRSDPKLSGFQIRLDSLAAAGSSFINSIDQSTAFDDQIKSAIGLGRAYEDFEDTFRRLPADLDLVAVATGKLRPRTVDAVEAVLALGEAARDYLATMVEMGSSDAQVAGSAAMLREEYAAMFRQLGFNEEQVNRYIEAMGLLPEQVTTAINVAGIEEARFKVDAYLSLLDGRIPPEVATSVIADVEAGNLDGAARRLAGWAATNPAEVPVQLDEKSVQETRDRVEEIQASLWNLPRDFDPLTAALGGYNEEQTAALEGVLAWGDALTEYLSQVVASGDAEEARRQFELIREGVLDQLGAFGIAGEAAQEYLTLIGLSTGQFETSLTVAFEAGALEKIQLYSDLLGEKIPPEVATEVLAMVDEGNLDGAAERLEEWRENEGSGDVSIGVDTDPADVGLFGWFRKVNDGEAGQPNNPVGANTEPATEDLFLWGAGVQQGQFGTPTIPLELDTARADFALFGFFEKLRNRPEAGRPKPGGVGLFFGQADGGYITGPGTSTSDSIPAMLSDGEYVIRAAAVDKYGVEIFDKLNKGTMNGFAMGGPVGRVPRPVQTNDTDTERRIADTLAAIEQQMRNQGGNSFGPFIINGQSDPRRTAVETVREQRKQSWLVG